MANTKLHDIEICIEEDTLKIIPYKLKLMYSSPTTPYFEADCSDAGQGPVFECDITEKKNIDLVGYVLNVDNWNEIRTNWDGYSEWNTTEYLTVGETPSRLKTWLKKLPTYQLSLKGTL